MRRKGEVVPHATFDNRRKASCACGALTLTAEGEPEAIYLCGCSACRRGSGGPFAWRARYAKSAISLRGTQEVWRRRGDAGRWIDQAFCPKCGTALYQLAEALPDQLVVSAGCFDPSDDLIPSQLFRTETLASWYTLNLARPHDV